MNCYLRAGASTGRKEPCVGATGADLEIHPPGAAWTVADVGGPLTVGVNPGVNIATGKVHAEEGL